MRLHEDPSNWADQTQFLERTVSLINGGVTNDTTIQDKWKLCLVTWIFTPDRYLAQDDMRVQGTLFIHYAVMRFS